MQAAFEATYGANPPHIRLWVSPYRRTRQTAEIVSAACGNYISSTKEHLLLAEQQFGLFEGKEAAEVMQEYVSLRTWGAAVCILWLHVKINYFTSDFPLNTSTLRR